MVKTSRSKHRAALGAADPFEALTGGAPAAARRAPAAAVAKPVRAQFNVLFDSWEWPDFLKAAAYIERRLPREVLADALKAYEAGLSPAVRRDIRAHVETLTTARAKPGRQ